jgi:hypothetical protein
MVLKIQIVFEVQIEFKVQMEFEGQNVFEVQIVFEFQVVFEVRVKRMQDVYEKLKNLQLLLVKQKKNEKIQKI